MQLFFCASARSAGRRILIKRPRAGDGADGQFFIDCAQQSIKNSCFDTLKRTLRRPLFCP
ncbi:hypothetical protein FMM72_04915 [Anaerotruncus colihominis]|uniref:Uncharacterized protein n=1 Tax=Anaerotruncus colihominis TaxID=169435 RepID=A0A845SW42_9FIRM|nr:hypothetical protein [Anaerotruncus colihominis]